MNSCLTKKQEGVLLQFMETSIGKINDALAGLYAIEKILIEKNIISEEALVARLKDARSLPNRLVGTTVLKEMLESYKTERKKENQENPRTEPQEGT
jgi:hypothetical protein